MKKFISVIVIVFLCLAGAAFSDPTVDDFAAWYEKKQANSASETDSIFDDMFAGVTAEIVSGLTEETDHVIYSTFELGNDTYVGFAKSFFIKISSEE